MLIDPGFADEHALILYVYLSNYDDGVDESVLTVGVLLMWRLHQADNYSVLHIVVQRMKLNGNWYLALAWRWGLLVLGMLKSMRLFSIHEIKVR